MKLGGSTAVGKFPLQSECSIKAGKKFSLGSSRRTTSSSETRQFKFELFNFEKISNFSQCFPTEIVKTLDFLT